MTATALAPLALPLLERATKVDGVSDRVVSKDAIDDHVPQREDFPTQEAPLALVVNVHGGMRRQPRGFGQR